MLARSTVAFGMAAVLWLCGAACALLPDLTSPQPAPQTPQAALSTASSEGSEYSVGTGIASIRFAYDRFLEMFFRPLRPSQLLLPAWSALALELGRVGVPNTSSLELPKTGEDVESAWDAFRSGYVELATRYASLLDQRRLAHAVIAAMAAGLRDCHTAFVTPEQFRAQRLGSRYVGIGVTVRAAGQDYPVLFEVFPASPAAQAGLRRGDRLVSIDGFDLAGASSTEVSNILRGPPGSSVRLSVRRASDSSLFETELSRQELQPPVFEMRLLHDSIGYMRFYSFGPGLTAQFEAGLEDLLKAGIRGLIIDVRSNPGGSGVDRIISKFVPDRDLYYLQDRKGNRHIGKADGSYRPGIPPLVVIVDQGSASAA